MMFQWTDGEVSHVVKLALESMRSSAGNITASHRHRLIEALAGELAASAWHAHTSDIDAVVADQSLAWATIASDLAHDWSGFCPFEFYASPFERLFDQGQASRCLAEDVVHRALELPGAGEHRALAWLAVQPQGSCACVEFLKPASAAPFSLRDEAVLRILSTELLPDPADRTARRPATEIAELAELPRRQREVLTRLLAGSSVKEIASDLGISHYTVNDYIKALYRRYQVSSRGELMAALHGLRRPIAPK